MWITNVPGYAVQTGHHPDPGTNSVLIQISDPRMEGMELHPFPIPAYPFYKTYQFRFLDMTDVNLDKMKPEYQQLYGPLLITDEQALDIAQILVKAYQNQSNVVVHCSAGICRSGAVTEVGVIMGFEDINNNRIPNLLVKRKLLEQLGYVQKKA